MRLVVVPTDPRLKFSSDENRLGIAALSTPPRSEILKRLRASGGTELSSVFIEAGLVETKDLGANRMNERLADAADLILANHEKSLQNFNETIKEFSLKFRRQAVGLIWAGKLPISIDLLNQRFRALTFELIDPLKSRDLDAGFSTRRLAVRLRMPILNGNFDYADFVHEVLHGLSGRATTLTKIVDNKGTALVSAQRVSRSGLSFNSKHLFEWMNEGVVEQLVSLFASEAKQDAAYVPEVRIIKALTDPEGFYKIPFKLMLSAFFADFDYRADHNLRFPEWHDLTRVFPTRQMLKIERMIANADSEIVAEFIEQNNLFEIDDKKLKLDPY